MLSRALSVCVSSPALCSSLHDILNFGCVASASSSALCRCSCIFVSACATSPSFSSPPLCSPYVRLRSCALPSSFFGVLSLSGFSLTAAASLSIAPIPHGWRCRRCASSRRFLVYGRTQNAIPFELIQSNGQAVDVVLRTRVTCHCTGRTSLIDFLLRRTASAHHVFCAQRGL